MAKLTYYGHSTFAIETDREAVGARARVEIMKSGAVHEL